MASVIPLFAADDAAVAEATERWLPVGVDLVRGKGAAPCDLFRKVPHLQDRYVLLCRQDHPFTPEIQRSPEEFGLRCLYIRQQDTELYVNYLTLRAAEAVSNPRLKVENKAVAVYHACHEVLQKVFEDPRAAFVNKAVESIIPTMNLIVSEDAATRCLFQLTRFDEGTSTHCTNVGIFGLGLARAIYGEAALKKMEAFGAGLFLHDMGKLKVPLHIIQKQGPLDREERQLINRHPQDGYNMLEEAGVMTDEIKILTLQHHERDDGTGYPFNLTADDIHPYARLLRLVDVYEAITSKRPYHEPRNSFEALRLMQETLLTDMDQELFEAFVKLFA